MYLTRKLHLSKYLNSLCQLLAEESGNLYSNVIKFFWRTVRKKNLWLKSKHLERLFLSNKLHTHSADASVQKFFDALKSWREVRKTVPEAQPPKKLHKYFCVSWKRSAIRVKNNQLILSNGKITEPLIISWEFKEVPVYVTMRWTGKEYELVCCYARTITKEEIVEERPIGIDIGQIHVVGTSDGLLVNGRELRAIRQGRERSVAKLNSRISKRKKGGGGKSGSKRRQKLIEAKRSLCRKTNNKVSDILHKYTTGLVMYLRKKGYNILVVGDLTGYRVDNDKGSDRNQENHKWLYSRITQYLKYKWERLGLKFVQKEESYTSQTCLVCSERNKKKGRNYICDFCGFKYHRDVVGAINILRKYLGTFGEKFQVDAVMTPAVYGVRYKAHMNVAHGFNT